MVSDFERLAATTAGNVTGFDYQVSVTGTECEFAYVINDAVDPNNRNFTYDVSTGRILITIP